MSFLEMAAAVGAACGAGVAFLTLLERLTGIGARWLARGVAGGTQTLQADVQEIKSKQSAMGQKLDEVQHLQRYHLGENGGSPRLHDRVTLIEGALWSIQSEQSQVRHDLEDAPRRPPFVDWNGPYDTASNHEES